MTTPLFFDEIEPGLSFTSPGILVTESHIVQFAGLSGDFFEVHMDDAFARSVGFPHRVAHGLLCLALIDGLKNRAATKLAAVASLEWSYAFRAPVFIGDRLEARLTVVDKRRTRQPDRGVVRLKVEAHKDDGVLVQEGINTLMVRSRV